MSCLNLSVIMAVWPSMINPLKMSTLNYHSAFYVVQRQSSANLPGCRLVLAIFQRPPVDVVPKTCKGESHLKAVAFTQFRLSTTQPMLKKW